MPKKHYFAFFIALLVIWQCIFLIFFNGSSLEQALSTDCRDPMTILNLQLKIQNLESQNQQLRQQLHDDTHKHHLPNFKQYKHKPWYPYLVQHEEAQSKSDTNSNTGSKRGQGGQWSWCTHIYRYGPNFDRGFASFLSTIFQPKTALEFGCGIGLYINYISKFSPNAYANDSLYLGIEPNSMIHAGIFNHDHSYSAMQLAMNIFEVNDRVLHSLGTFDLVYSSEVAEHIANPLLFYDTVDFLINRTAKYMVFGAARPDQGGTGHLRSSMWPREKWVDCFEQRGMTHLPQLSERLRNACYNAWDKAQNTFVMVKDEYLTETNENVKEVDDRLAGLFDVKDLWPEFQQRVITTLENKECEEVNDTRITGHWKEKYVTANNSSAHVPQADTQ